MDIHNERNKVTDQIVHFYLSTFAHLSGSSGSKAIDFVYRLQHRLETEMRKIISTKSIYYWFHIYRRIAPIASFENESDQTVSLYRNIMETAFLKYGKTETNEELVYNTEKRKVQVEDIASGLYIEAIKEFKLNLFTNHFPGIFLGQFGKAELLEINTLERLAYEYWHTTACLRRLNKGGTLGIIGNAYGVENDAETEALISSYDSRGHSFEDLYSSVGIPFFTKEVSLEVVMLPKYNIEQLSLQEYPFHGYFNVNIPDNLLKNFKPNFIWLPINLNHYFKTNEYYKESFRKNFGYNLESFVNVIYLVVFREYMMCRENHQIGIDNLKRSYRHIKSYDSLANELLDYYDGLNEKLIAYELSKTEVINVLCELSIPKSTTNISLDTLGPRYLLFPAINDDFIIDYASIIPILLTKMHFLNVKEELKGHLFEDVVISRLISKGFNLWECKKRLIHQDDTSKEIDLSFIYKNFLFIGELKSNKMSLSYIKGEKKSLDFRKKKIINAITQVEEKVKWLKLHTVGRNYQIPENVHVIVPFVVTPFKEYIWSRDKSLWMTNEIPRVCTPSECELLCEDEIINELMDKPFIRYVN